MRQQTTGIYLIRNTVNGKVYVGQSNWLESRKAGHFNSLRRGNHQNRNLQADWNAYKPDDFTWEVLEVIDLQNELLTKSTLQRREVYWITQYRADNSDYGYNCNFAETSTRIHQEKRDARNAKPAVVTIEGSGFRVDVILQGNVIHKDWNVERCRKWIRKYGYTLLEVTTDSLY